MAQQYYAGSGSVTIRAICTDPNTGVLVAPTSITVEIRRCDSVEYRHWTNGTVTQAASSMSSTATGEYYYVWGLSSVTPGHYVAQVYSTRGGQPSVERIEIEVL